MSSANTVLGQWDQFRALVISKDAPEMQLREMRMAFFGGAAAVLAITFGLGADDVSEGAGIAILASLHEECEAAALDYIKGAKA